ncbi:LacI family DNA-binding transcriptional regulator [Pseudonocardia kunmingensis]|uniref:LacI family transcriptional regulator n=1 Tax=Pseudonocardia kunmingensis TaxID=630975 RepID=A0A543D0M6_9PSEU|nr:LacI family DNA-binding transcriptional regulator [Pseudonocardia kunmingensis]TQM02913.1 LacI family transcriptional regulator [Pseudonocardia kunmingensis]
MAVNLRDVARRAGVSVPTASRVLSGSDYTVRAELRTRVEEAARELHYVPNAHARALLHGSSATVGVLAGDVGDPYFSQIIDGIQELASQHRMLVTICNTGRDVDRELEYLTLLHTHRTGVVIVAGSELRDERYRDGLQERVRAFLTTGGRVVAVGHPDLGVDRVLVDNERGARELGEHLTGHGHREVGVLAGVAQLASTVDRVAGLRAAVEARGGRVHVRHGPATRDGGRDGARHLLAEHPDITALVGTADQMAVGALAHLRERAVAVPGAVSVAGFNDILIARDVTPALTTVRLPLESMGAAALQLAMEPGGAGPPRVRRFTPRLVVRGSTGPRPR